MGIFNTSGVSQLIRLIDMRLFNYCLATKAKHKNRPCVTLTKRRARIEEEYVNNLKRTEKLRYYFDLSPAVFFLSFFFQIMVLLLSSLTMSFILTLFHLLLSY